MSSIVMCGGRQMHVINRKGSTRPSNDSHNAQPARQAAPLTLEELRTPLRLPFEHANHVVVALAIKRALDLAGGVLFAVLSLPLWLPALILIPLDSKGPVLFRQERVGARPYREGSRIRWLRTTFTVIKFRTMTAGADESIHRTAVKTHATGHGSISDDVSTPFKLSDDPRITRLGRFLRRTSIDELPQLLNVIRGEMSLVGPRPLPLYEVAEYSSWHHERHCSRPGITGLWQVRGRGRASFDEGTALDIDYVRRWSLALDLQILLLTLPAVFSGKGAR